MKLGAILNIDLDTKILEIKTTTTNFIDRLDFWVVDSAGVLEADFEWSMANPSLVTSCNSRKPDKSVQFHRVHHNIFILTIFKPYSDAFYISAITFSALFSADGALAIIFMKIKTNFLNLHFMPQFRYRTLGNAHGNSGRVQKR